MTLKELIETMPEKFSGGMLTERITMNGVTRPKHVRNTLEGMGLRYSNGVWIKPSYVNKRAFSGYKITEVK